MPGAMWARRFEARESAVRQHRAGYLSSSSMYEHGLMTTALAEMYGMDSDPELEETLRDAVNLIIACQSPAGGWPTILAPETRI